MAACQSEQSEEQSSSLDNPISIEPNAGISVGDKFSSYDDLKSPITAYEEENSVQLMQRDSMLLQLLQKEYLSKSRKQTRVRNTTISNFAVPLVVWITRVEVVGKQFIKGIQILTVACF